MGEQFPPTSFSFCYWLGDPHSVADQVKKLNIKTMFKRHNYIFKKEKKQTSNEKD
jgi:hypothetical protein